MTPLDIPLMELRLGVQRAEKRAGEFMLLDAHSEAELHDHRVAVAGDIADAIDRIESGLGMRLMRALYPEVPLLVDGVGAPL